MGELGEMGGQVFAGGGELSAVQVLLFEPPGIVIVHLVNEGVRCLGALIGVDLNANLVEILNDFLQLS